MPNFLEFVLQPRNPGSHWVKVRPGRSDSVMSVSEKAFMGVRAVSGNHLAPSRPLPNGFRIAVPRNNRGRVRILVRWSEMITSRPLLKGSVRDPGLRRREAGVAQHRFRAGRGGGDAAHPPPPADALQRAARSRCARRVRQAPQGAHPRGRRARHRIAHLARPGGRDRGPGLVQLPPQQEHDHHRRRRAGGERCARGRRRRGAALPRHPPHARRHPRRGARRGQVQLLGRLGAPGPGAAHAPGRLVPAPRAPRASLLFVPRRRRAPRRRAPAAARQSRPQLEHVHGVAAACRDRRHAQGLHGRHDAGGDRHRHLLRGDPPHHAVSPQGLSRRAIPGVGAHRARDRDAAALPGDALLRRGPRLRGDEAHPAHRGGVMAAAPELSVVIPVYNEEAVLPALFARLYPALDALGSSYEVIFVNDGSLDRSAALLREQFQQRPDVTRVILFNGNFGQHMAIMAGFEHVRGARVVTLDADLQNPPEEIGKLLAKMDEGHDYVGSIRRLRQDAAWRRWASKAMNRMRERITHIHMTDQGCMLRAYDRSIIDAIRSSREVSTYIPALAYSFSHRPTEVEVEHEERQAGESKYSMYKLIRLNFDIVTGFSVLPLQLFSFFGIFVSLASVGVYVAVIAKRLVMGEGDGLWVIWDRDILQFFLTGVVLFGLGLIGEYVGRIYLQVRERPRFIIQPILEKGDT